MKTFMQYYFESTKPLVQKKEHTGFTGKVL
jgi:hypothetical protein